MIERILGVDLGISSLGWAIVEYDKDDEAANRIIDCGVRLFTAAETPKKKESPNKARREARGIRRVLNRRRVRMNMIKKLFLRAGLIQDVDLDGEGGMFYSKANRADVWELRHDGLYRLLKGDELARVLIHIAKHRGYKFIGDDEADEESGKVKKAGVVLRQNFEAAGCRTVGEWLWRERGANGKKRNKHGDYEISIHRDLLVEEVEAIFVAQQEMRSTIATDALKAAYREIAFFVRPMQRIEKMVGHCTYFPEERRAPKSAPTAEKFIAISKFFSTVIIDNEGWEQKIIERKTLEELLDFAVSREKVEFRHLRKFLDLSDNEIFKGLHYKGKPKTAKKREATLFDPNEPTELEFDKVEAEKKAWISLRGAAKLREALGNEFYGRFVALGKHADEATKILTYYKDEGQKRRELTKLPLEAEMVERLVKIGFSDFLKLSLKAIRDILPAMESGARYDEAVLMLGVPHKEKSAILPPLNKTDIDILNPTVIRAFAQFRKVANALVRKYGAFDRVHFELAREINTKGEIEDIKESQRKNEKERKEAADWIAETSFQVPLTRKNILKKRLYIQQDGRCAYTGDVIELERLFDEGYCEIDHILPRSRSADDSFANKVLCLARANQQKTDRTPYEWFGHDAARWNAFETRTSAPSNRVRTGKGKIDRLLKKNFDENSEMAFKDRNLNDTRYMARAIKTYCEQYWVFKNSHTKAPVQVRSGKLTSVLRYQWGLESKDRESHTHHAVDAIIIAFSTQGMVQKLSEYYRFKETHREKERPKLAVPLANFRDAVEEATRIENTETVKEGVEVKRLLISRPPRARVTGQAHEQTAKPYPRIKQVKNKKKWRLAPIDEEKFESFKADRVASANQKNFYETSTIPRVDVYHKKGKFHLVPIYLHEMVLNELPNLSLGTNPEAMDENFFKFSIFKDDLISIQTQGTPKKPAKIIMGYFKNMHGANMVLSSINNSPCEGFTCTPVSMDKKHKDKCKLCPEENRIAGRCLQGFLDYWSQEGLRPPRKEFECDQGVKFALDVKKYQIDPLGYYYEVKQEKRLGTIPQMRSAKKLVKK
ncbi:type II CRISPR RNA-guided endonuclease Cas9 [Wolinella succinogenes]|uniref:CRISPR-associated endonuclease Cas9 n=1 Tax=Wolinella succinogenes (strain ATCC 29543 / DSM 1740 / CCUG 13145 / JCM 31913 / LMG 7466 / NCTC 11488 / FDC 602W) TaxID=273121 RepID=Q7MRD3_WOLSU|nr:type II CRISPR RNA-guided endonuclease Cas9 [Wolinella succinogenes]CAE10505.1 conserved hypothetical protein [Wolinella succinogenes]VEG80648.1 Uncharacterized protein conserved in bacteria [Wolinella succinogenes]HCZ18818.1 type II CRISPR RNA-guided endonuclease Cas9 [Helicobacter sp.]